jgi:hypothetical protein
MSCIKDLYKKKRGAKKSLRGTENNKPYESAQNGA